MTLLETLVVMLITAILLGLGITALVSLRNRLAVRNASSELVQNIASVRNDARNSVLVGKNPANSSTAFVENIEAADALDYYVIKFTENSYTRGICDEDINLNCEFDSNTLKGSQYDIVEIIPEAPGGGGSPEDCSALVVFLTTGRFQFGRVATNAQESQVTTNNVESCVYRLEHVQTRITRARIEINAVTGDIKII